MEIYENYYVRRFVAFLIDYCSLGIFSFILLFLVSYLHSYILFILLEVLVIIGCLLYEPFFLSRFGTTIGKRIMKLDCFGTDGYYVTFKVGIIRIIGKLLSIAVIGLGFIPMFFSKTNQTVYDKITNSIVCNRTRHNKVKKTQTQTATDNEKNDFELSEQVSKSRADRIKEDHEIKRKIVKSRSAKKDMFEGNKRTNTKSRVERKKYK